MLRPREQILDLIFLTLCDDLDASVGAISDPTRQAKSLCLPLGRSPKKYTLDATSHDQVDTLLSHESCLSCPLGK